MRTPGIFGLMCATAVVLPSAAFAQAQDDCDRLLLLVERDQGAAAIIAVEEARRFQTERNQEACVAAIQRIETANAQQQPSQAGEQGGSNIVVQQPAPIVTVDPATPQITVQQTQPNVMVRQAQPEILVRQPAPTVTVDIPQPEIIVRMPQPEVIVQQAQPQVQVEQAQPQVRVEQPEQPQVQVQESEQAQVQLTQSEGQASVQFEQTGEPRITYERAEANVMVNQPDDQPTVRIEQIGAEAQGQAGQQQAAAEARDPALQEQGAMEQQSEVGQQAAVEPNDQLREEAGTGAQGRMQRLTAGELEGMDAVNLRGEQIGDVEGLVRSVADNKLYVVIDHGGFLGLGEKRIALSLEGMQFDGNRLIVPGVSDDDIRGYPEFSASAQFPRIEDDAVAEVRLAQQ